MGWRPRPGASISAPRTGCWPSPGRRTWRTWPAFLRELAALDLNIDVTELDVNDRELPAAIRERERAVAAVLPEPRLKLITTWLSAFMPRTNDLPFVILQFLPSWQTNGHYSHFWTDS